MEAILSGAVSPEEVFDRRNENSSLDQAESQESLSEMNDAFRFESSEEYNRHLQGRIMNVRDTIQILKKQLQEEREIWKREMEERRESDYISRTAEMGYYYTDPGGMSLYSPAVAPGVSPALGAGLESDIMAKYSDSMLQSHYESRQNLQKQIAMANYKRRLLEVENMCNLELLRVKQSVQILQPLQVMCAEWRFPDEGGDFSKEAGKSAVSDVTDEEKLKNRPAEVSMPLELIAQRADDADLLMSETIPLEMSKSQPNLSDYSET